MKKVFTILITTIYSSISYSQVSPAVAANMKFAYEEISAHFTKETGIPVAPVYGSTGKLVTQIRNGAPFDIFISADVGFADSVCASKLAIGTPKIYAFGKLVLWTVKNIDLSKGTAVFSDPAVKTIALGDLKLTVYGPAAKNYFEKINLWESVEKKVVYGENISKVAQFIESGAADIGFSAKSIVLSDEMRGKGKWIDIDSTKYAPMPQAAVMLVYGENNNGQSAKKLFDYLYTNEARQILLRYGYNVP
jgi:molybdate transport system substrate-binding protein